jgi:catechol-2,3-dioxygenase
MQLNHLHLMVSDATGAAEFLSTYFGMSPLPGARDKFVVMADGAGMVLTLMQGRDHAYPKNFHVGFAQAKRSVVDALWQRLIDDGHHPSTPALAHAWSFYVTAPGGFMVEVLAPADATD